MDVLKLKIDIDDRRFEADAPANVVTAHANVFMKLTLGGNAEIIADEAAAHAKALHQAAEKGLQLDRIMRINGTEVSLNVLPQQSVNAGGGVDAWSPASSKPPCGPAVKSHAALRLQVAAWFAPII